MTMFLRRVRGVVRTALVWAGGWLLMMMPPLLYLMSSVASAPCSTGLAVGGLLYLISAWGAAAGTLFALGLIVLGRRRRWSSVGLPATIGVGVAAGAAVPISVFGFWWLLLLPVDLPETITGATVSAVMGGVLATTTLAIARHGEATAFPCEKEPHRLIHGE